MCSCFFASWYSLFLWLNFLHKLFLNRIFSTVFLSNMDIFPSSLFDIRADVKINSKPRLLSVTQSNVKYLQRKTKQKSSYSESNEKLCEYRCNYCEYIDVIYICSVRIRESERKGMWWRWVFRMNDDQK